MTKREQMFGPLVVNEPHIAAAIDSLPVVEARNIEGITYIPITYAGQMVAAAVLAERKQKEAK